MLLLLMLILSVMVMLACYRFNRAWLSAVKLLLSFLCESGVRLLLLVHFVWNCKLAFAWLQRRKKSVHLANDYRQNYTWQHIMLVVPPLSPIPLAATCQTCISSFARSLLVPRHAPMHGLWTNIKQERAMFVQRLARLDRLSEVHVQSVFKLQLEVGGGFFLWQGQGGRN